MGVRETDRRQLPSRASRIPHHMLIMVSGSTSQNRKGMLRRRSGAAVTAGVRSTTGLRFTAALCLRYCFAVRAALRVGFLADRATRFFALARVGFIFRVFFIHG